jgi:uncharacterized protein with ParB-like and HNH nuclease domain
MADPTQFDHDRLGHLLADRLLEVPRFQRSYAWDSSNVEEFLTDLKTAREKKGSYFMGTVVFAASPDDPERQLIVDGQQRLATCAILFVAIRDLLEEYGKSLPAHHIDETYLRGYDLSSEEHVNRLILNPADQSVFDGLLSNQDIPEQDSSSATALYECYMICKQHLRALAPSDVEYRHLVDVAQQMENDVQVLLAVASDLPEAYVIFETLNDRGADLTTADLLKNFLFSQAKSHFAYVQATWSKISDSFDKPEELVKFMRYELASRKGRIATRKLYRALQEDIGQGALNAKKYLERLDGARGIYLALRDPDHERWNSLNFDVRDALLAFRRFGFDSSMPLLLAAFAKWDDEKAGRLLSKVAGWSVRAQFSGKIGGGIAEESFGDAAQSVSSGAASTQPEVRARLDRIVPNDSDFRLAVRQYGRVSVTRAKYLLAMLERAHSISNNQSTEGLPDWSSKGVTIEHIRAKSSKGQNDSFSSLIDQLGNLTLLEKGLNQNLEDKPFTDKKSTYVASKFALTRDLSGLTDWTTKEFGDRADVLAGLAVLAWPNS